MDEFVKDHLEEYLAGSASAAVKAEMEARLGADARALESLSAGIRTLRAPEAPEMAPGFYARVMERIEAQRGAAWYGVFESVFARRMAFASFALVVLVGALLLSREPAEVPQAFASVPVLVNEDGIAPTLNGGFSDIHQGSPDAVLVNLAAYAEQ
jgi:hypothetical protein